MPTRQQAFEAIDWGIFSLGGIIAAFLLPAQVLITVILGPLGLAQSVPPSLAGSPSILPQSLVRLYLFLVLGGATWHAIHRIRFILMGLGLARHRRAVTVITFALMIAIIIQIFRVVFLI